MADLIRIVRRGMWRARGLPDLGGPNKTEADLALYQSRTRKVTVLRVLVDEALFNLNHPTTWFGLPTGLPFHGLRVRRYRGLVRRLRDALAERERLRDDLGIPPDHLSSLPVGLYDR